MNSRFVFLKFSFLFRILRAVRNSLLSSDQYVTYVGLAEMNYVTHVCNFDENHQFHPHVV